MIIKEADFNVVQKFCLSIYWIKEIICGIFPLTSDCAGAQQVHDIHVVAEVSENFQLGHQRLLFRRMGIRCNGIVIYVVYRKQACGNELRVDYS